MRQNGINRAGWTSATDMAMAKTVHIGVMMTPKNKGHLGAPVIRFWRKTLVFIGKETRIGLIFFENLMKIDLRHRQGRFESEELQSRNLDESSQAMWIPRTAGEAAEVTFRWKRSTLERPERDFVENCSARIVKCRVFQGQEALFEGCTFQMWRARRPQANKTGRWKLENGNVALSQGEVVFGQ